MTTTNSANKTLTEAFERAQQAIDDAREVQLEARASGEIAEAQRGALSKALAERYQKMNQRLQAQLGILTQLKENLLTLRRQLRAYEFRRQLLEMSKWILIVILILILIAAVPILIDALDTPPLEDQSDVTLETQ